MKRDWLGLVLACLILITSCKKPDQFSTEAANGGQLSNRQPVPENTTPAHHKDFRIREMIHNNRHYVFFYNQRGDVDSVRITQGSLSYAYKVYYQGARIDSVNLVMNGIIYSTNTDFTYKGKWITGYTYYFRASNFAIPPQPYTFTYDHKGNITAIHSNYATSYEAVDSFIYNDNNDVVQSIEHIGSLNSTYTYDTTINPLYFIPLFAIFVEEHIFIEQGLSAHNSLSRTYANGTIVNYLNQYNALGQLTGKTFYDNNQSGSNSYTFTYYP